MISTSSMLIRVLEKAGDKTITVMLGNKEYVIDSVVHVKDYADTPSSHLSIKIKDGGSGNIKR